MRRRCVPLGIIAGLGVLMLLLLPVQAQAKRRSVQANSVSALEQATKKLEKTGGIIWLGNRTYRLKKSIMIPSNVTIRGRKKTVIDGSMLKGRTAFVTKDSKEVHVRWIHFTKMQKGSAVKGIRSRNMRITDCSFTGGDYGVSFEGCYRPIVSSNTFTKLGQPIRFTISKKTVKKGLFRLLQFCLS